MKVLISGASGFIGRALCRKLSSNNEIIGVFHRKRPVDHAKITWEQADLTDCDAVAAICKEYSYTFLLKAILGKSPFQLFA